jgi:hypothetical protein
MEPALPIDERSRTAVNPFPGLRPFRLQDADLFFGRERECGEICDRLRATRFLAVTGVSGCGKSSLVRAGLFSRLDRGLLVNYGSHWRILTFCPGLDPAGNLAATLGTLVPGERESIRQPLDDGPFGLIDVISAANLPAGDKVLVLADQFEELFNAPGYGEMHRPGEAARHFVNLLLTAADQNRVPIYVVLTMRAEYVGYCSAFPRLAEAMNVGLYLVPQMTRRQIREAIEGPVRRAGGAISPRLVDSLLNEAAALDDQLPLLQHALMRMWSRAASVNDAVRLDMAEYDAVGRLESGLDRHGTEVLASLSPRQVQITETLFRTITDMDASGQKVRRPSPLSAIGDALNCSPSAPGDPPATMDELIHVLDGFRSPDCSFLAPDAAKELRLDSRIDLIHESLMRQWTALSRWVEQEGRISAELRRLNERAREWMGNDRDVSYLYSGRQLSAAESYVRYRPRLPDLESSFLEACRKQNRRLLEESVLQMAERD